MIHRSVLRATQLARLACALPLVHCDSTKDFVELVEIESQAIARAMHMVALRSTEPVQPSLYVLSDSSNFGACIRITAAGCNTAQTATGHYL